MTAALGSRLMALLLAAALGLAACGGSIDSGASGDAAGRDTGGTQSAGGGSAGSKNVGQAGKPGVGGSTSTAGAAGAGGDPVNLCAPRKDEPPGEAVHSEMELGTGECDGTPLSEVIAEIREARPDLADVTELYWPDPERGGDGSFIYAFRRPDGGFALVFKRGDGDCPAGCTVNDYWYFETGAACAVTELGEAHRDFEHCMQPDQLPRWGIPRAAQPSEICDADLSAQDVSGQYSIVTCGQVDPCQLAKATAATRPLPSSLELTIAQDPADLSHGTVTLDGTGEPLLDGQPFDATFERQSFQVMAEYSNLPANCLQQWSLTFSYDFEGFRGNSLIFDNAQTPDCEAHPDEYCKGQVAAEFGEASPD